MSQESLPSSAYTLKDLLDYWQQGKMTMKEVLRCWPLPNATREDVVRELLRLILGLHARIAAIDGIGDW